MPIQTWHKMAPTEHPISMMPLTPAQKAQTVVSDQAASVASDPTFAKYARTSSPAVVLQTRVHSAGDPLPTFMASYGTQHDIDSQLLQSHGYFGHFVKDATEDKGFRFWHATEIALIHGTVEGCFLPTCQSAANRMLGNMISIQHALFLLINGFNKLLSHPLDLKQAFQYFFDHQLRATDCHSFPLADGIFLKHRNTLLLNSFCDNVNTLHRWANTQDTLKIWTHDHGLVGASFSFDLTPGVLPDPRQASVITPTLPDTQPCSPDRHPFLQGILQQKEHRNPFWFSADLPRDVIEWTWGYVYHLEYQIDSPINVKLTSKDAADECTPSPAEGCAITLIDSDLTLIHVDPAMPLLQQQQIRDLSTKIYDQYGELDQTTKPSFDKVLLDKPLQPGTLPQHLVYYAAANQQARVSQRLADILKLCQDHKIEVPTPTQPKTREALAGAPWNKKKRTEPEVQPADYTIMDKFFTFGDGSNATQVSSIRPQASGVAIMKAQDAMPFLQTHTKISSDELGLFVIGQLPPVDFPSEEVACPCHNPQGEMVLLHGRFFQLGSKNIQVQKGDANMVPSDTCQLFAITLFQSDWPPHKWQEATTSTSNFIRQILAIDSLDASVQALWGRSFRNGKASASPQQATSVQMHGTVDQKSVPKMLQRSGFNGLFLTPKNPNGQVLTDYRVLWLKADLPKALAFSTQTNNCLGLIRGKNDALGLRYHHKDFDAAWTHINPSIPIPENLEGNLTFKLEGLPFGTSMHMLTEWAKSQSWPCKPFRAIGPTSWVVKAPATARRDFDVQFLAIAVAQA
eukprot:s351_g22.t1